MLSLVTAVPGSEPTATPVSAAQLAAMWAGYGDRGGRWTGGDSTTTVPLPDGRVAWLFSDTFLGAVNPDRSRSADAPLVHNTVVVQSGGELGETLHGGTDTAPAALVEAPANELYWVGDGTVTGGSLKVFYNRYQHTGSGMLDVRLAGTSLVTFNLPELTIGGVQPLPLGNTISWGSAVVEDSAHLYVYGTESTRRTKFAHLARVATTLTGAWEFWTGEGWSTTETDSARLLGGVGTAFSVDRVDGSYVLVTQDTTVSFSPSVVAHVAPAPQGPFETPVHLFDAPEPKAPDRFVYDARTHPELSSGSTMLVSYNVNSFRESDLTGDVRVYRPRFVEVDWPLAKRVAD